MNNTKMKSVQIPNNVKNGWPPNNTENDEVWSYPL